MDIEITLYRIEENLGNPDGLATIGGPLVCRPSTDTYGWVVEAIGNINIGVEDEEFIFSPDGLEIVFWDQNPAAPTVDADFFQDYNDPLMQPWCVRITDHDLSAVPFFAGFIEPRSIRYDAKSRKFTAEVFSFEHLLSRIDVPARNYAFETKLAENYGVDEPMRVYNEGEDGQLLTDFLAVDDVIVFNLGESEHRGIISNFSLIEDPVADQVQIEFSAPDETLFTINNVGTDFWGIGGNAGTIQRFLGSTGKMLWRPVIKIFDRQVEEFFRARGELDEKVRIRVTSKSGAQSFVAIFDSSKPGGSGGTLDSYKSYIIDIPGGGATLVCNPYATDYEDFPEYWDESTNSISFTHPTLGQFANTNEHTAEVLGTVFLQGGDSNRGASTVKILGHEMFGLTPAQSGYPFQSLINAIYSQDLGQNFVLKHLVNSVEAYENPFTTATYLNRLVELPDNRLDALRMILNTGQYFMEFQYLVGTSGRTQIKSWHLSRVGVDPLSVTNTAISNPIDWTEEVTDLSWPSAVVVKPNKPYLKSKRIPELVGWWYPGIDALTPAERLEEGVPDGEGVLEISVAAIPSREAGAGDSSDPNIWQFSGSSGIVYNDFVLRNIAKNILGYYENLPRKGNGEFDSIPLTTQVAGRFITTSELDFAPDTSGRTIFVEKVTYDLRRQRMSVAGRVGSYTPALSSGPTAVISGKKTFTDYDNDGSAYVELSGITSYDPNDGNLTYLWEEGAVTLGTEAYLRTLRTVGEHTIKLTVTNQSAQSDFTTVSVVVVEPEFKINPAPGSGWSYEQQQEDIGTIFGTIKAIPNFDPQEVKAVRYRYSSGEPLSPIDKSTGTPRSWYPRLARRQQSAEGETYFKCFVPLSRKHNSYIELYIDYQDSGQDTSFSVPFTFNALEYPELVNMSLFWTKVAGDLKATLDMDWDDDTRSIKVLYEIDDTSPDANQLLSNTPDQNGLDLGIVPVGSTMYVDVYGYNAVDQGGTEVGPYRASIHNVDGTVVIPDGSITANKLVTSSQRFIFKAGNWLRPSDGDAGRWNQISWAGVTIWVEDGTERAITDGTITMTDDNWWYIYWEADTADPNFKGTTDYATAIAPGHILLGVGRRAQAPDATSKHRMFVPAIGVMGGGLVINADHIGTNSITAVMIDVGDLEAVSTSTGSLSVTGVISFGPSLSGKIDGNGITLKAGTSAYDEARSYTIEDALGATMVSLEAWDDASTPSVRLRASEPLTLDASLILIGAGQQTIIIDEVGAEISIGETIGSLIKMYGFTFNGPNPADDGKVLSYDNGAGAYTWITAAGGGGTMSSWIITDGVDQNVNDGEKVTFSAIDGVSAAVTASGSDHIVTIGLNFAGRTSHPGLSGTDLILVETGGTVYKSTLSALDTFLSGGGAFSFIVSDGVDQTVNTGEKITFSSSEGVTLAVTASGSDHIVTVGLNMAGRTTLPTTYQDTDLVLVERSGTVYKLGLGPLALDRLDAIEAWIDSYGT